MKRVVGLALVAGLGCASASFEFEELPDAQIAFFHRSPEAADLRQELLLKAEEEGAGNPALRNRQRGNYFRLEEVASFLGLRADALARLRKTQGSLVLLHPRTGELTPVEATLPGARPLDWSADHRRLLFSSLRHRKPQVFEFDVEGREVRPMTHGPHSHPHACYGPEGRIAYAEVVTTPGGDFTSRIFVTQPGGGRGRPVTDGPQDLRPAWSRDGRHLIFQTKGPRGEPLIARVDLEEGGAARVLARGTDPSFSPDGAWVVFSAKIRKGRRIWRMRPDGSGKLPIGGGVPEELDPVFSPDGRFVLFVAEEIHRQSLVVRRLDGTGERILFNEGGGSVPVW